MGENKDLDWDSLNKNGTMSKLFSNYRSSYYYQYPSLYTMENAESIEVNQDLLSKGVLYITFNYGGRKDGELVKSVLIINYSSQNQTLETISEKDYGSISALFGQLRVNNGETIIAGQTFYVFTEVKEINIPQWVYIALGIALIGMVVGFRQLMIHLLKKKKGIDYDEFKKANKEKSWFRRRKKDTIVKEESLFETFFTSDPLIKERKEIAKKAKEERRLKKQKAKEDSLEQKESKEENQDTSAK
jgi:hypothetical protein